MDVLLLVVVLLLAAAILDALGGDQLPFDRFFPIFIIYSMLLCVCLCRLLLIYYHPFIANLIYQQSLPINCLYIGHYISLMDTE